MAPKKARCPNVISIQPVARQPRRRVGESATVDEAAVGRSRGVRQDQLAGPRVGAVGADQEVAARQGAVLEVGDDLPASSVQPVDDLEVDELLLVLHADAVPRRRVAERRCRRDRFRIRPVEPYRRSSSLLSISAIWRPRPL